MTATLAERASRTKGGTSFAEVLSAAWPALLLATVCLVPFLNKAFIMDDPHFLAMARQIVNRPRHPMDFQECWNTVDACMKAYTLTPGNVLMGYALVPTVLGGAAESMAHLTQLTFAWVAILAMSSFVLRFGWSRGHAMAGALILVAVPPFLPMASTAMPDILSTTMAIVAMERLVAWKSERKWPRALAAAVALGLAGIARPHLILLLPLGAFYLLESVDPKAIVAQLRRELWLWIPVFAGGAILVAVILATRETGLLVNPPPLVSGPGHILRNLRSFLLYFCFPLPLAVFWAANRWKTAPRLLACALIVAAAASLLAGRRLTVFLPVLGAAVFADLLFQAWKTREHTKIFLLLWLLIPLPVAYYIHLPIKYLLPCMPAVILLGFSLCASIPPKIARAGAIILVFAATGYSVLILRSDAEFAEFGRESLTSLVRLRVAAGEKVWSGGDFSSYWYAKLAGAEVYVPGESAPKPGDFLVVGIQEEGERTLKHFPNRELVESRTHKYSFGRTVFEGIGLYTNMEGNWLWGFADRGKDRYELWRIQ